MMYGLQYPVYSAVGDEHSGLAVCKDCLLWYPRENKHIVRGSSCNLRTVVLEDHTLGKTSKGREEC